MFAAEYRWDHCLILCPSEESHIVSGPRPCRHGDSLRRARVSDWTILSPFALRSADYQVSHVARRTVSNGLDSAEEHHLNLGLSRRKRLAGILVARPQESLGVFQHLSFRSAISAEAGGFPRISVSMHFS